MKQYFLSVVVIIIAFLCAGTAKAANDPDSLYRQGKFKEAQKAYAEADMNHPKDIRFRYNRGCAAYKNSDYKAATAAFSSVLKRMPDKDTKFKALYNLGNTAFKQKDFKLAASYYKQAIISNPESKDAGYNLELCMRELEKQKQKDSKKKEDKQGKNKDDNNKNQKASDKQSSDSKENKKDESEKRKEAKNNNEKNEPHKNNNKQEESNDRSQDFSRRPDPSWQESQQKKDMTPEKAKAMLDKKRANELLNNIKENRSLKAFGNKGNMRLGKDW